MQYAIVVIQQPGALTAMKEKDYVTWSGEEDGTKFSYKAQVVSVNEQAVQLLVPNIGTVTVELADGQFEVIKKPADFEQLVEHVPVPQPEPSDVKKRQRSTTHGMMRNKSDMPGNNARGDIKMQTIAVYRSLMVDGAFPKRSDAVKHFVDTLHLSKNTASTYENNCKRRWCNPKSEDYVDTPTPSTPQA